MNIIFIIGMILVWTFGFLLSGLFIKKDSFWEKFSLGFILGIGIFTFVWFLLNWASIPFNLHSGFALVLGLNFLVLLITRIKYGEWFSKIKFNTQYFKKLDRFERVGLGILIFLIISAFIQNLYWPIHFWDSLVLYDFRARLFAQTGFMQAAISQGYFFGYPLLTSLAHTWVYILGIGNPSFLYSLFYIFFLVNFFINVKKMKLTRLSVIILTLLVAVSPRLFEHTQWAYTNLPYTAYIVLGSIYLYWGAKNKDFGLYALSAVLIGLSTWTRSTEPFWLTYVGLATISALAIRKWSWPFVYAGLVALLMMPWRIFQARMEGGSANVARQIVSTSGFTAHNLQFSVVKPALDFVMTNVVEMYLIYFVLFGVIILFKIVTRSRKWLFTAMVICNLVLIVLGTIVFSVTQQGWRDIPDSLSRMVMFIPPMIIFLLSEESDKILGRKK